MADQTYKVRDPTGAIREIRGPAGATDEQVIAQAQTLFGGEKQPIETPQFEKDAAALVNTTPAELASANPIVRVATSAARPILGGAKLIEKLYGGTANADRLKQLDEMQAKGQAALYPNENAISRVAPDVAGAMLSPLTGGAAMAAPAAAGTLGRVAQGAQIGGLAGVTSGSDHPMQDAGVGAAIGGVLPAGWEAAKAAGRGIRNVVQPYMGQAGADQAAGRLANLAAGERQPAVVQALQNPQQIVPGSMPTAGQAAAGTNSAEFAALQNLAAERNPSAYFGPQGIEGQQAAARNASLGTVAQTPQQLAAAELMRGANATQNYGTAYQQAVKADPELAKLAQNPYFQQALPDAMRLAESKGISAKTDLTEFLHQVKLSLDKSIGKTGDTALSNAERAEVMGVKDELLGWLAKKNPSYDSARAAFAADSVPINQMQVGQYLQDKLNAPLGNGVERAGVYSQALRDVPGTLKRSTGFNRYDELGQVLNPQQVGAVEGVKADLERKALAEMLAKQGMPAVREKIGASVPELPPTGFFNMLLSAGRGAYNRLAGGATEKTMNDLAARMQNPQEMARIMQSATPFERQKLVDLLMRGQAVVPQAVQQGGAP